MLNFCKLLYVWGPNSFPLPTLQNIDKETKYTLVNIQISHQIAFAENNVLKAAVKLQVPLTSKAIYYVSFIKNNVRL